MSRFEALNSFPNIFKEIALDWNLSQFFSFREIQIFGIWGKKIWSVKDLILTWNLNGRFRPWCETSRKSAKTQKCKKKKNSNFKRLRAILTCQPLITIGLDKKKVKNFRTFHSFATKRMTTDENLVWQYVISVLKNFRAKRPANHFK